MGTRSKSRPQSRGTSQHSQKLADIQHWTEPVTIRPSHVRKRRGIVERVSDENVEPSHPNIIEQDPEIKERCALMPEKVAASERRTKASSKGGHQSAINLGKATMTNCSTPKQKSTPLLDDFAQRTNERRRLGFGVTPHRAFPSPSCFPQEEPNRWVKPSGIASSVDEFACTSPLSRFRGGHSPSPKRTSPRSGSRSRRAATPGITPRVKAQGRSGTPRDLLATPINACGPSSSPSFRALGETGTVGSGQQRAPPLPIFGSRDRSCSPTVTPYPVKGMRSPVGMAHGARALASLLSDRSTVRFSDQ